MEMRKVCLELYEIEILVFFLLHIGSEVARMKDIESSFKNKQTHLPSSPGIIPLTEGRPGEGATFLLDVSIYYFSSSFT